MNLDASLSLEVVIAILAIFGAVWRLDGRIAELRKELRGEIADLRRENAETRRELKGDIQRLEIKIDDVDRRLGEKIDEGNQRLARLEGRFEGREERLTAEGETDSPA